MDCTDRVGSAGCTHPVEHVSPALQSDALEHRQHGLPEVVEARDAPLRPLPVLATLRPVGTLEDPTTGIGVLHHLACHHKLLSQTVTWTTSSGGKYQLGGKEQQI